MTISISESSFEPSTLVEILRRRVIHQPERLAYTFLLDGEESLLGPESRSDPRRSSKITQPAEPTDI